MNNTILQSVRRINRRRFLTGAAATTVGTYMGASVGRAPLASAAGSCVGPHGTGPCPKSACSKHKCVGHCGYTKTCHGGTTYCWSSGGKTCCDCKCAPTGSSPYTTYCYCYG
jgi:hypothetical protein